jgi:hypothetical protein
MIKELGELLERTRLEKEKIINTYMPEYNLKLENTKDAIMDYFEGLLFEIKSIPYDFKLEIRDLGLENGNRYKVILSKDKVLLSFAKYNQCLDETYYALIRKLENTRSNSYDNMYTINTLIERDIIFIAEHFNDIKTKIETKIKKELEYRIFEQEDEVKKLDEKANVLDNFLINED